jgi:uncharacterized membrane protein YgcG
LGDNISTQGHQKRNKSVKLDYFLYSCFEFEQTCKASPGRALSDDRWPETVAFFEGENNAITSQKPVKELVGQCLDWYGEQFPALRDEHQLNLANIANIIPAAVFLALDLKLIYERSSEYDGLTFKESSPDHALWDELQKLIRQHLPNFAQSIFAYVKWAYTEKEDVHWEIGNRPPVGRYAPRPKRSPQGARGQRDRSGGRTPRSSSGNQRNQGGRPQRNGGSGGGSGGGGGGRGRPNQQKEKQALHLVEDAVKTLKSNPDQAEIKLPPANSFYRRLQHKHVMTLGFYSESSGEGHDRAVVIRRHAPENEDSA